MRVAVLGPGGVGGLVAAVLDACAARFANVRQLDSRAEELADQVEAVLDEASPGLVVSVGGDGTVRDVAEGIARGRKRGAPPAAQGRQIARSACAALGAAP